MSKVMRKEVLSILIPDGEADHLALPVICCLANVKGLKIHVLSSDPWSNVHFSRHCASFTHYDSAHDDDHILDVISSTVSKTGAEFLLPVSESGIRLVASHRNKFDGLILAPVPPLDSFDKAIDKWQLADFMQTNNMPTPHTILLRSDTKLNRHLRNLKFPVLLKPTRGTNGRGIRQFDNLASLEHFLESHLEVTSEFIIQELVQGYDIDCSVLCLDGEILAFTIQKGIIPNRLRFLPPIAIEFLMHEEVLKVVRNLVSALGWSGVAHLDLRVDEEEGGCVKIIELNARYWASLLGSFGAGVNFPHLSVIAGLGQLLPKNCYRHNRYIEPYQALKLTVFRSLPPGVAGFGFSETGWRYLLNDPLPNAVGKTRSLWKSLKKKYES